MYSVVILTLNEARNLPVCLASLRDCDDVVVLDSGSNDGTAEIARAAGARVEVHPFENFAAQRNFANREISFRHPWVFHLDADERFTSELASECRETAHAAEAEVDGYFVAPKMIFRGRWIPHCTDFPAYQARFVRVPRFEFIQVGHGQREAPSMRLQRLRNSYLHDLSADGEDQLERKHRRYAREEAQEVIRAPRTGRYSDLFAHDALSRRRALKRLSQRLPFRGALRFVYQYGMRGGFLDGRPGLAYCWLMARYEHWIAQEMRRQTNSRV